MFIFHIQSYCSDVTKRPKTRPDSYDTDTDTEDDYSESLAQPQGKRNTDKSLYWISQKAQTCPLCHRKRKGRMVSHFTADHKNSEVFVSRISPKMVDLLNGKRSVKTDKLHRGGTRNRSENIIRTMCVFCEEEKNFPASYWNDHIRSHTGTVSHSRSFACSDCIFRFL